MIKLMRATRSCCFQFCFWENCAKFEALSAAMRTLGDKGTQKTPLFESYLLALGNLGLIIVELWEKWIWLVFCIFSQ